MFSKMYKKGIEWRRAVIKDDVVEKFRVEQVSADLDLYALILAKTKERFPQLHVLSQERIALAVFDKKADAFYTEIQNLLDDVIDIERDKME